MPLSARPRMGRPDAREDPRVRRPVGIGSVEPFRTKRGTAMPWTFGLVMLAMMLSAEAAGAQEVRRLEPVVVTATTVETPAEQLGASVTVVEGDDFQTRHYPTVEEALRKVPGMEVQRSGSFGKLSTISIRGMNSNQVQVLIDGV